MCPRNFTLSPKQAYLTNNKARAYKTLDPNPTVNVILKHTPNIYNSSLDGDSIMR